MPARSSRRFDDPLRGLAWLAATSIFAPLGVPLEERVQVAYLAILAASRDGLSERSNLLRRANIAMMREYRSLRSFRGQRQQEPGLHPHAVRYWTRDRTPYEERVVERMAVRQVMTALPWHHRQVITDLAEHGIRPRYAAELRAARMAAWRLWHDWEQPQRRLYR